MVKNKCYAVGPNEEGLYFIITTQETTNMSVSRV
uniref:Uncharacterized protein n=1 Tax=Solanum lycopersicum TaxID=4081 RepID=K4D6A0_SOLLC